MLFAGVFFHGPLQAAPPPFSGLEFRRNPVAVPSTRPSPFPAVIHAGTATPHLPAGRTVQRPFVVVVVVVVIVVVVVVVGDERAVVQGTSKA